MNRITTKNFDLTIDDNSYFPFSQEKCEGPVLPFEPDTGFLELEVIAGFRVWQLAFMGASAIMCIVIVMCCFMRCRIPRTKQEIEADVARKKVTKQFSKHLEKIPMELMELEKVLPEVITLEHQRILKGIKEEKMTIWQKVKKMICSGSTDEEDEELEDEEDDEKKSGDDIDGDDDDEEVDHDEDDENNDVEDDEDEDGDETEKKITEKDVTEATDDSVAITVVEGNSNLKNGKSLKSQSGHSKRPSKAWKKIANVTATSHAIRSSKQFLPTSTDSPKSSSHRLQEVIVDPKSKIDHGHTSKSGHSSKVIHGETSKKCSSRPPTRPPSQDHDDNEQATRL